MMRPQSIFAIIVLLGLMPLLTACPDFGFADRISMRVNNSYNFQACLGGLRARFQAGKLDIESPVVPPEEIFDKILRKLPSGIGTGTPITFEAWCYDADSSKAPGYIRIEQPWRTSSVNSLYVFAPHPKGNGDACIKGNQSTEPVPCIRGHMFRN